MSEPTLTDEQREALDQWYTRDHEVPVMADAPLDRLHAVVAAILADERAAREAAEAKVRDLIAGIGALADTWQRTVLTGYCGDGCDYLARGNRDRFADDLRALVDDPAAALAEAERWQPTRWWRAVGADGATWAESSDEKEVRERARPGDRIEQAWEKVPRIEWRAEAEAATR